MHHRGRIKELAIEEAYFTVTVKDVEPSTPATVTVPGLGTFFTVFDHFACPCVDKRILAF